MITEVDRIDTLIAYWLTECPDLAYKKGGSRAEKASSLTSWHCWRRINDPIYHYKINGHRCSWKNQVCDCLDLAAPKHPDYGRLCKHRLAIWMIEQLAAERYQFLESLVIQAHAQALPELVFTVRTTYTNGTTRHNTQLNELLAWRAAGQQHQWLAERVTFTIPTLQAILFENRYCIAPGQRVILGRHHGGRERWFLIPMADDVPPDPFFATNIGMLFGIDVAIAEERAERRRLTFAVS